ncbi:hypothetical protein Lal_00025047 [Lupinus albus]|nr:hypothetical protein Lal_00025047 [Lupinus albus]
MKREAKELVAAAAAAAAELSPPLVLMEKKHKRNKQIIQHEMKGEKLEQEAHEAMRVVKGCSAGVTNILKTCPWVVHHQRFKWDWA